MFNFIVSICLANEIESDKQYLEEQAAYNRYIEDLVQLENSFVEKMRNELYLNASGNSRIAHGRIEQLGLKFVAYRRANIDEARALELLVIDKFVHHINADEKLRPYFVEYPFKYINISISFCGSEGGYCDGTVHDVSIVAGNAANEENRNIIFYDAQDPYTEEYIPLLKESYEEAVKRNAESVAQLHPAIHLVTPFEDAIDQLFERYTEEIWKEYGLHRWSLGGKLLGEVEEIGARYIVFQRATPEEARALLVQAAQKMMDAVNNNETLSPYLKESPFSVGRLKMHLAFRKRNYCNFNDDSMEGIALENGIITFYKDIPRTGNQEPLRDTLPVAHESYQDALNLVQQTPISLEKFKPRLPTFYERFSEWLKAVYLYLIAFYYGLGGLS